VARFVVGLLLVLVVGWWWLGNRPIPRPDGVLVPGEPVQEAVLNGPHFQIGDYDLQALAHFELDARVLSAERYRTGRESELSPLDLALGWGPMSSNAAIDALSIWQSGRFYQYSWSSSQDLPLKPGDIISHSANMHMIPLDSVTRETLLEARRGNLVHLTGWLVEAKARDGWRWRSSLSRGDTGGGACEVVLVEALSLE